MMTSREPIRREGRHMSARLSTMNCVGAGYLDECANTWKKKNNKMCVCRRERIKRKTCKTYIAHSSELNSQWVRDNFNVIVCVIIFALTRSRERSERLHFHFFIIIIIIFFPSSHVLHSTNFRSLIIMGRRDGTPKAHKTQTANWHRNNTIFVPLPCSPFVSGAIVSRSRFSPLVFFLTFP